MPSFEPASFPQMPEHAHQSRSASETSLSDLPPTTNCFSFQPVEGGWDTVPYRLPARSSTLALSATSSALSTTGHIGTRTRFADLPIDPLDNDDDPSSGSEPDDDISAKIPNEEACALFELVDGTNNVFFRQVADNLPRMTTAKRRKRKAAQSAAAIIEEKLPTQKRKARQTKTGGAKKPRIDSVPPTDIPPTLLPLPSGSEAATNAEPPMTQRKLVRDIILAPLRLL